MDNQYIIFIVAAIVIVLLALVLFLKLRNRNAIAVVTVTDLPFNVEKFIEDVGGIDNIVSTNSSMSKITLELKDTSLVNIKRIEELGASGIVEKKDGMTFIFGNISQSLETKIKEKM